MDGENRQHKKYGAGSVKWKNPAGMILPVVLAILLILLLLGWLIGNRYFRSHYAYGTTINGVSVFQMTEAQVKEVLQDQLADYTLELTERTGDGGSITESITGQEIGLQLTFDDSLDRQLAEQEGLGWITALWNPREVTLDTIVAYDAKLWKEKVDRLQCFQDDFVVKPQDAALSDYQDGVGYVITDEVQGNQVNRKTVEAALEEAVLALETSLDLNTLDCYKTPAITKDDPTLLAKKEALEKYTSVRITYDFDDTEEVLDGSLISQWISIDSDLNVTLDTDKVADYVATLRKRYDSIFRSRTFDTSYGETVTLDDGDYGWWMNYTKEAEELTAMIEAGESGQRTPVYYQTAASYGEHDYGDTYVEVNLTAQHLFFYQDGELVLESDFVSGNPSKGNGTPEGVYGITYKQRDATLVGENYETPVSYWMPFNENVGLHDATWRSSFGNDIYKSSGSHGCVNLPYATAKKLYSLVSEGTPVICYNLEGTESDSQTEQTDEDIAQSAIDAINAIGDVTKESKDQIERARQVYEELTGNQRSYVDNYDVLTEAEAAYKALKKKS